MSKHTIGELRQKQSLPLEAKVIMTKQRIKSWYEHFDGDVYVSFSGGKDSTVLKHIVDSMYDDVPSVFIDTGLEYPEVRSFARSQKNVEVIRPKMKFYEVIEKYGYPVIGKEQAYFIDEYKRSKSEKLKALRWYGNSKGTGKISEKWKPLIYAPFNVSAKCCDIMKKNPIKAYEKESGRYAIIGTMTEESIIRQSNWLIYGCNAFEKKRPTSQPLSFWTGQDVLQFIKQNNLEIASVYGDIVETDDGSLTTTGCKRTGCMFCAFGAHMEQQPNRFQMMQKTHPKQWSYCINKLGMGEVLDFINVPYENKQLDMFEGVA